MGSGHLETPPTAESIIEEAQRRLEAQQEAAEIAAENRWQRGMNRFVFWLSKHWLALFNVLAGLYIGGTFLAPILMKLGLTSQGELIYRLYAPFCHQYPFRSWFIFGRQWSYPALRPLQSSDMQNLFRTMIGNEQLGYKVALCQRDVAIYGAIFLGGLLYGLLRDRVKIRPIPLWSYLLFGITPMMLDGGLQWLSYFIWWLFPGVLAQPHETTAFLRTLTGALFGLGIIALGYPYMQDFFKDTYQTLHQRYHWT
ncbi:MAG TPA: DUF2085 domain-containing protein [Chloroflexi bacterium]|nr:DUF2085 domain-containing protein [Chloroflexota bacterium]